jgi:hypothetical protein
MVISRRVLFGAFAGILAARKVGAASPPAPRKADPVPPTPPCPGTEWTALVTLTEEITEVKFVDSAGEMWKFYEARYSEPSDCPSYGGAALVALDPSDPSLTFKLCDTPRGHGVLRSCILPSKGAVLTLHPESESLVVAVISYDIAGRMNSYAKGVTPRKHFYGTE